MSAEQGDVEAVVLRWFDARPDSIKRAVAEAYYAQAAALERAERELGTWPDEQQALLDRAEKAERALANSDIRTVASDSRFSNEYLGIVVRAALLPEGTSDES